MAQSTSKTMSCGVRVWRSDASVTRLTSLSAPLHGWPRESGPTLTGCLVTVQDRHCAVGQGADQPNAVPCRPMSPCTVLCPHAAPRAGPEVSLLEVDKADVDGIEMSSRCMSGLRMRGVAESCHCHRTEYCSVHWVCEIWPAFATTVLDG